ncbi:MAG: hypothetical protein J0I09_02980 [Sphingobacteriia bacterium]|nr:hypothetical protein [Sphingobacteriia bacterium]
MNQKISIQLKALFLLLVFSLNTVVGFACALGMDMGFNTSHHGSDATEVKEIHVHADGAKHHHGSVPDNESSDKTKSGSVNHHNYNDDKSVIQEQNGKSIAGQDEGGCCSNEVLKFQSLDKNLNQTTNSIAHAPIFVAILSTFLGIDLTTGIIKEVPAKLKSRFYYPPPPDIRIAIQRFQI